MPPARLKNIFSLLTFCFLFFGGFISFNSHPAKATLESCSASISPSTIMTSSSANFNITLTNTGSSPILYFQLNSPSSEFTIQGKYVDGWSGTSNATFAQFWGGSLDAGSTLNVELSITTGSNELASSNWIVDANDTLSTDGLTRCTGSLGVAISGVADFVGPTISDTIAISGITDTAATFGWTTDEASTSKVTYGTGEGLDEQFQENASLVTTHSLTVTGLTASTTYYYSVCNSDVSGNQTCSDYGEFTTATVGSSAPATTTTVTTTIVITPAPTARPTPPPKDTIPPSVTVSTDFSDPFITAPTVEGKAVDGGAVNVGVTKVEYSLDGGINWLPVDNIDSVGSRSVSYDFTPVGLEDANYQLKVRATDSTGNVGQSKISIMVIDRLPPQVGGTLFSIGPMILRPDSQGNIYSIAGLDIKATLSAVGGPISMDLLLNSQKFSLFKNIESGLWGGILKFNSIGSTKLKVNSIDGAENETERNLSTIVSLEPGKVTDQNLKSIHRANIKVYTFEKTRQDFVFWDGLPYSQTNPQETDDQGEYRLFLPPGKYFLEVEAKNKRRVRTEIFELAEATPINQNFVLEKSIYWGKWFSKTISFTPSTIPTQTVANTTIGKLIPDFDLSVGENIFNNTTVLGKPTVLTFLSTWEPQSSDQLLTLDNLQNEYPGVNFIAIATQESLSKVDVFKKIGGYTLRLEADPDGVLVIPLNLESLPAHVFLDRKGIIKDVVVGYLNKKIILNKILE